MKYIANPVEVDAFQITAIKTFSDGSISLHWGEGNEFIPSPEMLSRISPKIGDYIVRQSDGYEYLNPKEVFERKYRPLAPRGHQGTGDTDLGMGKGICSFCGGPNDAHDGC